MNTKDLLAARQNLKQQTRTIVTDKKLNQYQEILQPDGTYLQIPLGNKKSNLTEEERKYFLDKQVAPIIPNQIYLGNADVAKDKELLLSNGISHIVNLATGIGNLYPEVFSYFRQEIADNPTENLSRILDKTMEFMDSALLVQTMDGVQVSGRVFVHCNQGVSRSPAVIIAYLMSRKQMKMNEAYQCVFQVRPVIQPNAGFMKQLSDLENKLFNKQ